jgi:hypothetical protein
MICFEDFKRKDMFSAACCHYFCKECWHGYVSNAISSGPSSLDLRCPAPECKSKACVRGPHTAAAAWLCARAYALAEGAQAGIVRLRVLFSWDRALS